MAALVTPKDRFTSKHSIGTGCWEWHAYLDRDGYGTFWLDGTNRRAHRVAYEIYIGPIPDGLELDHLCRNRACVRPDHLEPVTSQVNNLRGEGPAAAFARATHCVKGHLLDGENLYERPGGGRRCIECGRAAARRYELSGKRMR